MSARADGTGCNRKRPDAVLGATASRMQSRSWRHAVFSRRIPERFTALPLHGRVVPESSAPSVQADSGSPESMAGQADPMTVVPGIEQRPRRRRLRWRFADHDRARHHSSASPVLASVRSLSSQRDAVQILKIERQFVHCACGAQWSGHSRFRVRVVVSCAFGSHVILLVDAPRVCAGRWISRVLVCGLARLGTADPGSGRPDYW